MKEPLRRPTLRAQKLRREATPAERALWKHLSGKRLGGFKFSRQMPIGLFVCDFLCRSERLAIELDGESHDTRQEQDTDRDHFIAERGVRVLRFSNAEIFKNMEGVLISIELALKEGPPSVGSIVLPARSWIAGGNPSRHSPPASGKGER